MLTSPELKNSRGIAGSQGIELEPQLQPFGTGASGRRGA